MTIKIILHEAEEGGFWAEVPAIPGCATQGDSMDELLRISAMPSWDACCRHKGAGFPQSLPSS
jgi:hypothetical protein